MSDTNSSGRTSIVPTGHSHRPATVHVLRQRAGVPYEVERKVCAECRRVLDERRLRRAAA